ncbi:putative phage tail assembly chaperone [Desulfocurvibacter africanus]|uniref:putative phage tail assembly chaperone n=1 Tax=Desulfocurvibacter africanus TaxID=873 RepID=UPI0003FE6FDA|nr:putative phage tail assembly chaperone [Desulfocurvibacter africanus]
MNKTIKLIVKGKELTFNVDVATYNMYLNSLTPNNKIAPAKTFLQRTVDAESREALKEFLELPGAPVLISNALLEEYMPDLEIELGK